MKITKGDTVVHTTAVGEETFVYDYAFEDAGDYLVFVKATALGTGGVYESKYSTAYSHLYFHLRNPPWRWGSQMSAVHM